MTSGTPLVLQSLSRSQEIVSATATVDSHFDFFILFCVNHPTNEGADGWTDKRTKKRTNKRFMLALSRIYPAVPRIVPCATAREMGRLGIEFGFQQNQKLILILRDAITALLACVATV